MIYHATPITQPSSPMSPHSNFHRGPEECPFITVFWIEVDVLSVTEVTDEYQWVDPVRLHSMIDTDANISNFRGDFSWYAYQPDDVPEGDYSDPGIYHPRTAPLW